jgi:hypothetical protein
MTEKEVLTALKGRLVSDIRNKPMGIPADKNSPYHYPFIVDDVQVGALKGSGKLMFHKGTGTLVGIFLNFPPGSGWDETALAAEFDPATRLSLEATLLKQMLGKYGKPQQEYTCSGPSYLGPDSISCGARWRSGGQNIGFGTMRKHDKILNLDVPINFGISYTPVGSSRDQL